VPARFDRKAIAASGAAPAGDITTGDTIVAGAPGHDGDGAQDQGAAYVFVRAAFQNSASRRARVVVDSSIEGAGARRTREARYRRITVLHSPSGRVSSNELP
jgi:hypothetical protein